MRRRPSLSDKLYTYGASCREGGAVRNVPTEWASTSAASAATLAASRAAAPHRGWCELAASTVLRALCGEFGPPCTYMYCCIVDRRMLHCGVGPMYREIQHWF